MTANRIKICSINQRKQTVRKPNLSFLLPSATTMRVTFANASSYVVVVEHSGPLSLLQVPPQTTLLDLKLPSLRTVLKLRSLEHGKLASTSAIELTRPRLLSCKPWSSLSLPVESKIRVYTIRVRTTSTTIIGLTDSSPSRYLGSGARCSFWTEETPLPSSQRYLIRLICPLCFFQVNSITS